MSDALSSVAWHSDTQRTLTRELAEERRQRILAQASEKSLREALLYKDAAAHEAHHRTKNSLQIAASLLSLNARASDSPEVRHSLQEARSRLHVLAQVHELFYLGDAGTREMLLSTLLASIADGLRKSFAERSAQVVLTVAAEPMPLAADRAVPIALLANEIITNAYKHAFPEAATGTIAIELSSDPQQELVLRIADDGIGMPEQKVHETLGLRLIGIFAKQLRGNLTFTANANSKGTVVTLAVPLLNE